MYARYLITLYVLKIYVGNLIVPIQKELLTFLIHT